MSFEIDNDNAPQPFIRENGPKRRKPDPDEPTVRPSSGGLGCALMGIVIVLVVALIGVALFLPPFSIGDRLFSASYIQLNQQAPGTTSGGLSVGIDPANPGTGFGVRLRNIAFEVFTGQAAVPTNDSEWITPARAAMPQSLTLLSPIYVIEKQGQAKNVRLSVAVPPGADVALTDLYRYDVKNKRWLFVPSHPSEDRATLLATVSDETAVPERLGVFLSARQVPILGMAVDVGQPLKPDSVGLANVVYPAGLQPIASGALQGVLPADVELGRGYAVVPVIRNFTNPAATDPTIITVLQNSGLRSVHIQRLIDFAVSKTYQGLAIDYRRIPADQRDNFTAFISTLAQKLHNSNLTLTVVVPFPTQEGVAFNTGGYDWRAIGASADTVQVVLPLNPQAFSEGGIVSSTLQWAVGEVNRARLQIVLSVLSVQETEGSYSSVGYNEALSPLGQIRLRPVGSVPAGSPVEAFLTGYRPQFDPLDASNTPSVKYFTPEGTLAGTMWLTTGAALGKRLERIGAFNIAGVVLPDMNASEVAEEVPGVLARYKLNEPVDPPTALSLVWSVTAGGNSLAEKSTDSGQPFSFTPTGEQENIQFSAAVKGTTLTLGPLSIRVTAAVPPTATPLPAAPDLTTTETPTLSGDGSSNAVPANTTGGSNATPTSTPATANSQPASQTTPTDDGDMMG